MEYTQEANARTRAQASERASGDSRDARDPVRDETSADNISKGRDLENYNVSKINTLNRKEGARCISYLLFELKITDELSYSSIRRRGL